MSLPLEGVTVLDFTRAVAGPFCTMQLADLGARVIKLEEPGTGDETRSWGPPFVEGDSTYWLGLNRNKESIAADLKRERERVLELVRTCDVTVENFRPGVMDRIGLGYETLRQVRPGLIYASVRGFGRSAKPGYDLIVQAVSGLAYTSSMQANEPGKTSFPVADVLAALFLSQAILAALLRRDRTGEGARIEVPLLESLLAGMAPLTSAYLMAGTDPKPAGNGLANIVPYQIFRCADGHVAVGVPNERIWERFCRALGKEAWLQDERWRTNPGRIEHRRELIDLLEPVLMTRGKGEWEAIFGEAGVPCGAVGTVGEALQGVETWDLEPDLRVMASPMKISNCEMPRRRPPRLNEQGS